MGDDPYSAGPPEEPHPFRESSGVVGRTVGLRQFVETGSWNAGRGWIEKVPGGQWYNFQRRDALGRRVFSPTECRVTSATRSNAGAGSSGGPAGEGGIK